MKKIITVDESNTVTYRFEGYSRETIKAGSLLSLEERIAIVESIFDNATDRERSLLTRVLEKTKPACIDCKLPAQQSVCGECLAYYHRLREFQKKHRTCPKAQSQYSGYSCSHCGQGHMGIHCPKRDSHAPSCSSENCLLRKG